MKYGEQLEKESVPEWRLHNVDYNSLKHEIKVHTVRDQATAIAIPGQPDQALKKFEDRLYGELCHQHDRVDLFVVSKSDEIFRRLEHTSNQIQRISVKWAEDDMQSGDGNDTGRTTLKRQRKMAKYERELLRCGEDALALEKFVNAQVVAFRKILKKHKKWTGSAALGNKFRDNVLLNPKSFTRRDFSALHHRYENILCNLRAATPAISEPSSPSVAGHPDTPELPRPRSQRRRSSRFTPLPPPRQHYWNEYDDGSEQGEADQEYTIYVTPDEETPLVASVRRAVSRPFRSVRAWLSGASTDQSRRERQRLFTNDVNSYRGYGAVSPTETDGGYTSSEDFPAVGYETHYATLPSINEQRLRHFREQILFRGTVGCLFASFVLLAIAGVLIGTGRHRLRVEVDVGVTLGVAASLLSACIGLGMHLYRRNRTSAWHSVAVWSSFLASCALNCMLLVSVVGNSAVP